MGARDIIIPTLGARVTLRHIGESSHDLPYMQRESGIVFADGGLSEHNGLWDDLKEVVLCMSWLLSGNVEEISRGTERC